MTRVLFLIKSLTRGGAERLLLSTAAHLDHSFRTHVAYVVPEPDDLVAELTEAGCGVTCLDGSRGGVAWARRLRRLVRSGDFDIVHAHSPHPAAVARLALARPRPAFIYTEHNTWDMYHRVSYWANMLTYGRNDHVLTVSDQVRRTIRYPPPLRFLRMPPIETLYHGIDLDALMRSLPEKGLDRRTLGIPEDAPVIGTIANFRPEKGHRYLLEAAARVRETLPGARFVLVGGGPGEGDVRRQVRSMGLDQTVVFTGYRSDPLHVARIFDVFALSSLHEGLPIALVEMMALGKPVVVTDAGGTPEVVRHGKDGLVVPARQPHALAEGMLALLSDRGLRERMADEGRRRARDFDMPRAVKRLERLYTDILAGRETQADGADLRTAPAE